MAQLDINIPNFFRKLKKLVTTPAYMLGPSIKEIATGIEKLVLEVFTMASRIKLRELGGKLPENSGHHPGAGQG